MSNIKDKVIVITGASSGIGEAAAIELARKGAKLVLGARREPNLKALVANITEQGGSAVYQVTDVTQQADVSKLIELAIKQYGRVDVIINNAGLMPLSFFSQIKVDEWERMIDVNIKGVLYGIAAVMPFMREQGSGHIINVASIAGHMVFPTAGVYCATKHAVRAISEGLRQEEQSIRSTIISPGSVATELPNTISDERLSAGVKANYQEAIPAQSIANAIAWAIEQPDDVDINEILVRPLSQKM